MLREIRFQNFRSIKDCTLKLQKVNLLIGPNNSGKSNILKAFVFFSEMLEGKMTPQDKLADFINYSILKHYDELRNPIAVAFYKEDGNPLHKNLSIYGCLLAFNLKNKNEYPHFQSAIGIGRKIPLTEIYPLTMLSNDDNFERLEVLSNVSELNSLMHPIKDNTLQYTAQHTEYSNVGELFIKQDDKRYVQHAVPANIRQYNSLVYQSVFSPLRQLTIYKPVPSTLLSPYPLTGELVISPDCSNLVAVFDVLRDKYQDNFNRIQKDLCRFLPEFTDISFETDKRFVSVKKTDNRTYKRLGLKHSSGRIYWADELSDGTLYFLSLLAIIHQPNPPKIILLEEPEAGIHPRRIAESLDLLTQLTEEKDIQVIMTTHSPFVVDYFSDMPEAVFVVDKKDDETIVKNLLADVIEPTNKELTDKGFAPIEFTSSLGEHWAMGFLGGVPDEAN